MSQPDPEPDRYKSRGRKERTPAQLDVLAQAREKAKIVIAERAKLNAIQKTVPSPEPVSEEEPPLRGGSVRASCVESRRSGWRNGRRFGEVTGSAAPAAASRQFSSVRPVLPAASSVLPAL